MKGNLYFKTSFLPRLQAILKILIKPVEYVNIPTPDLIELVNPNNISTFISIGANDGIKNDPIFNFIETNNWKGVMVEPMPSTFNLLKQNLCGKKNISFVNACITKQPGIFDFYYIKNIQPNEPDWYDQVGSLDKETFYKNISVEPSLLKRVGVCQVNGITFSQLMDNHSLTHVDLVLIDTEGFDYQILSSIDLKRYKPRIIIFEYEWLSSYELKLAKKQLLEANYKIKLNNIDCIAIKR